MRVERVVNINNQDIFLEDLKTMINDALPNYVIPIDYIKSIVFIVEYVLGSEVHYVITAIRKGEEVHQVVNMGNNYNYQKFYDLIKSHDDRMERDNRIDKIITNGKI